MGVKPSNLITLRHKDHPQLLHKLARMQHQLKTLRMKFLILKNDGRNVLLLIYNPRLLEKWLVSEPTKSFLQEYGYPAELGISAMLTRLRARVNENGEFPHEIGCFLGYHLEDVIGFINNSKNYETYGIWKVYGNVETKKKIFDLYDRCKANFTTRMNNGESFYAIFC